MQFAAALSEHPVAALAVGEVAGEILEKLGPQVDVLLAFISNDHAGAVEDIAPALRQLLQPKVMIGCLADGVIGPYQEVLDSPGLSLWAATGCEAWAAALSMDDSVAEAEMLSSLASDASLFVLADPSTYAVEPLLERVNALNKEVHVIGGYSGHQRLYAPGTLILNGQLISGGAVALTLASAVGEPDTHIETVVAPGARPIGVPLAITKIEGKVIYELGGISAMKRLGDMLRGELDDDDMDLAGEGLLIGRVVDERQEEFGIGDFAISQLENSDGFRGTITVSEGFSVGTIVQFQVTDERVAKLALVRALSERSARAGIVFSSALRQVGGIESPGGDAELIGESLGSPQVAGMLTSREFGTLSAINVVNELSATVALFS